MNIENFKKILVTKTKDKKKKWKSTIYNYKKTYLSEDKYNIFNRATTFVDADVLYDFNNDICKIINDIYYIVYAEINGAIKQGIELEKLSPDCGINRGLELIKYLEEKYNLGPQYKTYFIKQFGLTKVKGL